MGPIPDIFLILKRPFTEGEECSMSEIDHLARVEAAVGRLSGEEATVEDLLAYIEEAKREVSANEIHRRTNVPGPPLQFYGHAKETRK